MEKYPRLLVSHYMKIRGISQHELSQHTGLTDDTIRKYQRSEVLRIDWNTLSVLADALGVDDPRKLIAGPEHTE